MPCDIEVVCYVGRPIDCDNVVLKTFIDGLRDWGTLKDDDPRFVASTKVTVKTKQPREYIHVMLKSIVN